MNRLHEAVVLGIASGAVGIVVLCVTPHGGVLHGLGIYFCWAMGFCAGFLCLTTGRNE